MKVTIRFVPGTSAVAGKGLTEKKDQPKGPVLHIDNYLIVKIWSQM